MTFLQPEDHDNLRRLNRAGASGLPLGEVGAASAIMLALERLVVITARKPDQPEQRVTITSQGRAHLQRLSFA